MFKNELSDHPLGLRKQSGLVKIRVTIHLVPFKSLTVMKMYLADNVQLAITKAGMDRRPPLDNDRTHERPNEEESNPHPWMKEGIFPPICKVTGG